MAQLFCALWSLLHFKIPVWHSLGINYLYDGLLWRSIMKVYYDGLLLLEWIILCLKELTIVVKNRHKPNKEVKDLGIYIAVLNILISLWKSTDY